MISDPQSVINDMIRDQRTAALLKGEHFSVPAPQPGLVAAKPPKATGSRVDFADLVFDAEGSNPAGAPPAGYTVDFVRSLRDPAGGQAEFYTVMGGSTPDPKGRQAARTTAANSYTGANGTSTLYLNVGNPQGFSG